ncbi:hypothetical protein DVW87_12735 [Sphingomonas aracearum]|uniref:Inner membrane protein n=2 Tax=Sphingomonas aracearum TaxID=2283317 RepID=A0A369VVP8_9SPHN|nr:hypothetical protein DVW87_12735 [Sphingomonas aracearum]
MRGLAWAVLLAFALGLAAMAAAMHYYARWTATKAPTAGAAPAAAQPVVIVPAQGTRPGGPGPVIDLDELSTREGELSRQLAGLEARTASVGQSAAVASGNATRAEAMLIAFAARRQIDRGLPLGYLENQLVQRFGATQGPAVTTVRQAAASPVTLEDLRAGLDAIAPDLVTGASSAGWLASLRRELSSLVVLRRAGTASPMPSERLSRARRLLEAGQVGPALAEVARLPGAAQAQNWTAAARRYVDARAALDTIETSAIAGTAPAPVAAALPAPAQQPAPTPAG